MANVDRKSVHANRADENNGGATDSRTKCRTVLPASTDFLPELSWNERKYAAMFRSRGFLSETQLRRRSRFAAELLSSAAESRRDGAKTVVVKVEFAQAGTADLNLGAAQGRHCSSNVMRADHALEAESSPTARQVRPARSSHSLRTLTKNERCSAQIDWCWQGHSSNVTKRFLIHGLVHGVRTKGMNRQPMNQARRNPAEKLATHQSSELCSGRNVPANAAQRRRLARPRTVGMADAIQQPRFREVRAWRRMETVGEVHCHSEEGTDLTRGLRRGAQAEVDRTRELRSESLRRRGRLDGGIREPNARIALRFRTRSIQRGADGILYGDWI